MAMFSLPNDCNKSNEISSPIQLSEVGKTGITNHDVINNWPIDWINQQLRDETRRTVSSLTWTNYAKETINDSRRDELGILDSDTTYFSADMITDSTSLNSLTNYIPTFDVPNKEYHFNIIDDHIDNSWPNERVADITNRHADLTTFLKMWKPSVELIDDNEILQNTTVVTPQKLKNVVPVTFSSSPSLLQLNSLQKNIITTDNKKQMSEKWYCVFCFNNARFAYEKCGITIYPELSGTWRTHLCKDSKGVVICPALAAHICRHCGATGKFAHTEKYCSSQKKRQNQLKNLTWAH
uniref:Nanos-type domain-containing protein n=1 Tax=Onchocerca volvulus TaxID=6282 RepID=A0A8R1TJ22_ONCVO